VFRKLRIVFCVGFVLILSCNAPAQYVGVGVDGPIPYGSLGEMESALQLADANQKADLLVRLGVDSAIANKMAQSLMPGQTIELRPLRSPGKMSYGIAFLPSGTSVYCFLYLLAGPANSTGESWHVIDSRQLDCWHGAASLEIAPLRRADADDLLLHHVNEGHGSGYVADQTRVFSILNGKLVQTLVTQDYLLEAGLGDEPTREQVSTLVRFPMSLLEETRTTAKGETLKTVERRYWYWSQRNQKFLPTAFVRVTPPTIP
jgi:hypothetical protein